jgi:hypothetical protein
MTDAASSQTGQKKRIALLLSGLPRQWRMCLHSQLFLFRNHQVDVYFHFWDTIDDAEKAEIVALLKPRAYVFEALRDFTAADANPQYRRDNINIPSRLCSQYASWREVAKLMEPHKADYDLAMRCRADVNFVRDIEPAFSQLKPNDLFIPWWEKDSLLSDMFALGDVEAVLHYHKLFDHLPELTQGRVFNPEILLMAHLETYPNIHILTTGEAYFFVRRPHMKDYTVEQALMENPGRNKWLDPEVVNAHLEMHSRVDGEAGTKRVEFFRYAQTQKLIAEIAEKMKTAEGVTEGKDG